MGVVNVTPDSFSDGGQFHDTSRAVDRALRLAEEGAEIIDVGGESTRPGSRGVDAHEEMARVVPVIEGIRRRSTVAISVDSGKAAVVVGAAAAGADIVNDVRALREQAALAAAVEYGLTVVLMHMLGEPRTMQQDPRYDDVLSEVRDFLLARARACRQAGIPAERIVLDPGFGFGKTLEHNLTLLRRLPALVGCGYPVLAGLSRKSMIEKMIGRPVGERLHASVALALAAAARGAAILRVHDVAATVDALRVTARVEASPEQAARGAGD
jgi:dihydropteroate synthase